MNFGPWVSPQGQNVHNFGNARLVEPGVTNWPVTTIGMWGYRQVPYPLLGVGDFTYALPVYYR